MSVPPPPMSPPPPLPPPPPPPADTLPPPPPRTGSVVAQSPQPAPANAAAAPPRRDTIEWGSRSVDVYRKIEQVGEGTYGRVYKASYTHRDGSVEYVALKKVRMETEKEGFPITAIREIKILRELDHPNIVKLREIVTGRSGDQRGSAIYMVFEFLEHDLAGLMNSKVAFTEAQIKCYMKQLLEGIHYIHKMKILHRDIKASNLLINDSGVLKIADFGLARPIPSGKRRALLSNRVVTLWYRAPELLMGSTCYDFGVDIWSCGCILGELLAKKPLFPGNVEAEQLEMICRYCGTPTEENWPGVSHLPLYSSLRKGVVYKRRLRETYPAWPTEALKLVDRMLELDPKKRCSAAEALDSEWFWSPPMPAEPSELPHYDSSHEWTVKQKRRTAQGALHGPPAEKRQKEVSTSGPGPVPAQQAAMQASVAVMPPTAPAAMAQMPPISVQPAAGPWSRPSLLPAPIQQYAMFQPPTATTEPQPQSTSFQRLDAIATLAPSAHRHSTDRVRS